jgi:hypothetical protein
VAFCLLFTYSQKAARIDGVLFCQAFLFTLDRKEKSVFAPTSREKADPGNRIG